MDSDLVVEKNGEKFVVPTGAIVTIPCYKLHRDERHWEDPHKFDPSVESAFEHF